MHSLCNKTVAESAHRISAFYVLATIIMIFMSWRVCNAATTLPHYYAHDAVEDQYGVIAPWYTELNGAADMRIRIAAETIKRYPWTSLTEAVEELPHYMYNSNWNISNDGVTIKPLPLADWACGDLGDRSAHVLNGLAQYYTYTGDPAAIAHITLLGDLLIDHCQTPADNPWPKFLISVPTKGKVYGDCDPHGMIQLDIVGSIAQGMLKAYQITGNTRFFETAKHWADLFAEKRNRTPGADPWLRYANPEDSPWSDNVRMTGGVAYVLTFLDELIRLGYTGTNNSIVEARDAGRVYLRDTLLPAWEVDDTWGRNYWDWPNPVHTGSVTRAACRYIMANKDYFPNWRNDVRNVVSLLLNHTGVYTESKCEVYSGAWAYPESSSCCFSSLWYLPLEQVNVWAQYGIEADSEWAREHARRIQILVNYDINENGLSEDNIFGGMIVNNDWFKIAHPQPLNHLLMTIGLMPELFGANRENHIVRTSSVVNSVVYAKGKITYSTYNAPENTVDVLRLAFVPNKVSANDKALKERQDLNANGYTYKKLSNGDCIVTVRHDNATNIVIAGPDPQSVADDQAFSYSGNWSCSKYPETYKGSLHTAKTAGDSAVFAFEGNQVRLTGRVDTNGGLADVYLDGVKQIVGIDFWNPGKRDQQVVYYRNGLPNGKHEIKIVASGTKHGRSDGSNVYLDSVQWSTATGKTGDGVGGGPADAQRWVFGYAGRDDITDSMGNKWRPATEFIVPLGTGADSVVRSWWRTPVSSISGTPDPELYKYGVHSPELVANFIVAPGTYHACLKFAATRGLNTAVNNMDILINGQRVVQNLDVAVTAGGPNKAVDLVFTGIKPRNGVVEIRFINQGAKTGYPGEAFVQAIEVGPGDVGAGATPMSICNNLLNNPGFEEGVAPASGATNDQGGHGWSYSFTGAGTSYIKPESASGSPGSSEPGSENEAIRVSSDGNGRSTIYQDVIALPNTPYQALVWVMARNIDGQGFGHSPSDSAGLHIEELDAAGNVVVDHPKVTVSKATSYTILKTSFVTGPSTANIRYALETAIACNLSHGSVTYDNCILDGPVIPGAVTGKITSAGSPQVGVTVTIGELSAVTDSTGAFKISGVPVVAKPIAVSATKDGYFSDVEFVKLRSGDAVAIEIEMTANPKGNLLANPSFEDGAPYCAYAADGKGGVDKGWSYKLWGSLTSYLRRDSVANQASKEPEGVTPGPWSTHSGYEASRHTTASMGHHIVFQEVAAAPDTQYLASVWVKAVDLDGSGFGVAGSNDSAGLWIQELADDGSVVSDHPKNVIRTAGEWTPLSVAFKTHANTTRIRYQLETFIGGSWTGVGHWEHGWVTYDDCILASQANESKP